MIKIWEIICVVFVVVLMSSCTTSDNTYITTCSQEENTIVLRYDEETLYEYKHITDGVEEDRLDHFPSLDYTNVLAIIATAEEFGATCNTILED